MSTPTEENTTPAGAPANSKRVLAGVLGILLGAWGIHKFVLGYTKEGIITLLISLLGSVLTFGLAAGVMMVIGLAEGIIYLTKTDEQFEETYVKGRKGWF